MEMEQEGERLTKEAEEADRLRKENEEEKKNAGKPVKGKIER
jgi:hypothetical protein